MRDGGFDFMPMAGASETTDSVLFLDAPNKLPMLAIAVILAAMGAGSAPLEWRLSLSSGYVCSILFLVGGVITSALAIKLFLLTFKKDMFPNMFAVIVKSSPSRVASVLAWTLVVATILTISKLLHDFQVLFARFLVVASGTDLTVLYRFVAVLIAGGACAGFCSASVSFSGLWYIAGASISLWVAHLVFGLVTLFVAKGYEAGVVETHPIVEWPKSAEKFASIAGISCILFVFPNVQIAASRVSGGRLSRCVNCGALALSLTVVMALIGGGVDAVIVRKLGRMYDRDPFFNTESNWARVTEFTHICVVCLTTLLFMFAIPDMVGFLLASRGPVVGRYQNWIAMAVTFGVAVLLSFWNLGADILFVINSSWLIPIVMWATPAIGFLNSVTPESRWTKGAAYWCLVATVIHIPLGVLRLVYVR